MLFLLKRNTVLLTYYVYYHLLYDILHDLIEDQNQISPPLFIIQNELITVLLRYDHIDPLYCSTIQFATICYLWQCASAWYVNLMLYKDFVWYVTQILVRIHWFIKFFSWWHIWIHNEIFNKVHFTRCLRCLEKDLSSGTLLICSSEIKYSMGKWNWPLLYIKEVNFASPYCT